MTRHEEFWPPLYGWGSSIREDSCPRNPVLYSRRTRGTIGHWWAETRRQWQLWWGAIRRP